MSKVYLGRRKGNVTYKYCIVFYMYSPVLKFCDFSKIHSDQDIFNYFSTIKNHEDKKLKIEIELSFNIKNISNYKKITDRQILDYYNNNSPYSFLRVNINDTVYTVCSETIPYGNISIIREVDIPDSTIYKSLLGGNMLMLNWKWIEKEKEISKGNSTKIVMVLTKYMRRLWIKWLGKIEIIDPLNYHE